MARKSYDEPGKMETLWYMVKSGDEAEQDLRDRLVTFFEDLRQTRRDIHSPHMAAVEAEVRWGIPHDVAKAMYMEETEISEWDD